MSSRLEMPAHLEIGSVGIEVKAEVEHIRSSSGVTIQQVLLNDAEIELDEFSRQDLADEIETLYPEE